MNKINELFVGWYDYSDEEFVNILKNGKISFDTNILLDLYRFSKESSQETVERFEEVKDRLFFSYYVAFEFTKNRKTVELESKQYYKKMKQTFEKKFDEIINELNKIRNQNLPRKDVIINSIEKEKNKVLKVFDDELNKKIKMFDNGIERKICSLISTNILEKFDDSVYIEEKKEGKRRFENHIPPGYMDSDKDENGDYYIYKQLINYSCDNNCDIIFVTGDKKEDMFINYDGIKKPRPELLQEFYDKTGHRLLILDLPQFVNNEIIFSKKISDEALNEIKYFSNLNGINGYYMPKRYSRLKKFYAKAFLYNDNNDIVANKIEIRNAIKTLLNILSSSNDKKSMRELTELLQLLDQDRIEEFINNSQQIRKTINEMRCIDLNNLSYYRVNLSEYSDKIQMITMISELISYMGCYIKDEYDYKNYIIKLRAVRDSLNSDVISISDAYDEITTIYDDLFMGDSIC